MPGKGRKRDLRGLPELEGWLTFTEAAETLGISRQRFYQLAEAVDVNGVPRVKTAQKLGARPTYIVRTAEVTALKAQREGTAPAGNAESPLFHVAGGAAVTEDDLRQAIAILDGSAGSRGSFKQAMAKAGNPLATSDYMTTARQYRILHPEKSRGLSTKQVLLEAYKAQLSEAALPAAV